MIIQIKIKSKIAVWKNTYSQRFYMWVDVTYRDRHSCNYDLSKSMRRKNT